MPDYTLANQLPYPTLAEPPDGPLAVRSLAERIEAVWATANPCGGMKQTATQAIVTTTQTQVTFGATMFNYGNLVDLANHRFVVPVAGVYDVHGVVAYAGATTGYRRANIRKNGVDIGSSITLDTNIATGVATAVPVSFRDVFAVADTITLAALHTQGANLSTTLVAPYLTFLVAHLVQKV